MTRLVSELECVDPILKSRALILQIRNCYGLDKSDDERYLLFTRSLNRAFALGVRKADHAAIFAFLETQFGTHDQIADFLSIARDTYTKQKSRGDLDAESFALVRREFGKKLRLPSDREAAMAGYVEAVPVVYQRITSTRQDHREKLRPIFTREECECVFRTLPNNEWAEAQRLRNLPKLKELTRHILNAVHAVPGLEQPWRVRNRGMLEGTLEEWSESCLLCVSILCDE
jgi:hypothetical protein